MRLLLVLIALALSSAACGSSTSNGHDDTHRPETPDELVLAERYRAVSRSLAEADPEPLCAVARGEAAVTFRCHHATKRPFVPRELRSLRPDLDELYVYPDLDALVLGAPLLGRQDRLFVRFKTTGKASSRPIDFVLVGVSG